MLDVVGVNRDVIAPRDKSGDGNFSENSLHAEKFPG